MKNHRPFALVLAGGGACGLAHAGVLRGLDAAGYRPSLIVGVSMGAIIGATYGLNPNWYAAVLEADPPTLPYFTRDTSDAVLDRLRSLVASEIALHDMMLSWGIAHGAAAEIKTLLHGLTLGKRLEEASPPVVVLATDLATGTRVTLDTGDAAEAVYASSALAGVFPPVERDGVCLVDGGYSDLAPVDVAHTCGQEVVVAVDPNHFVPAWTPSCGIEAMVRSVEISQQVHSRLRLREADVVLRPRPSRPIATLEFQHKRLAVAAGLKVVRHFAPALREVLRA